MEKEILALKAKVLSLLIAKDDVITKLEKALYHIKDHEGLILGATETILELCLQMDVILELCLQMDVVTLEISNLQNQGDSKNPKVVTIIAVTLVKQDGFQCESDSQTRMTKHFKKLLEKTKVDHVLVLVKSSKTQEPWKRVVNKMDVWK